MIIPARGMIGVLAAAAAGVLVLRNALKWGAVAFLLSAIAPPSGFAYVLNLIPLALTVVLLLADRRNAGTPV